MKFQFDRILVKSPIKCIYVVFFIYILENIEIIYCILHQIKAIYLGKLIIPIKHRLLTFEGNILHETPLLISFSFQYGRFQAAVCFDIFWDKIAAYGKTICSLDYLIISDERGCRIDHNHISLVWIYLYLHNKIR